MMGCWGVKAFESDEGLDVLEWIRNHIPEDGCLHLKELLNQFKIRRMVQTACCGERRVPQQYNADCGTDGKLSKWYHRRMGVSPGKTL